MPPDPFTDRPCTHDEEGNPLRFQTLQRIADKVDAGEPVDIEPGGYRSLTADQLAGIKRGESLTIDESYTWPDDFPRSHLDAWSETKSDLDEWRSTYGRLDIPVRVIDWRPIAAGVAALTLAAIAHRMARHGR